MGTKLHITCDDDQNVSNNVEIKKLTTLDESFIDEWFKLKENHDGENYKAEDKILARELEELRRASANSESVGAEVSFNLLKKRNHNKQAEQAKKKKRSIDFPPLLVMDHDDCMSFYEYYLNSCGGKMIFSTNSSAKINGTTSMKVDDRKDVPLLLNRGLGPAKYMTLRQLTVLENHSSNNNSETDHNNNDRNIPKHSLVDIRGPIMPCAVRDLLCAAVAHLSFDKSRMNVQNNEEGQGKSGSGSNSMDHENEHDENELGSHYFVMHLHAHDEDQVSSASGSNNKSSSALNPMNKVIGKKTSMSFNGVDEVFSSQKGNQINDIDEVEVETTTITTTSSEFELNECSQGDVVTMAVWDINRPLSVAYKCDLVKDMTG